MAVPTGSGTETIHAHSFEDVDNVQTLIFGVQHHVYTVLSIIVFCRALDATTDFGYLDLKTYDNHGGGVGQTMRIAQFNIQVGETYVWNDKFSFNGCEPDSTAVFSAALQLLNAAQGTTTDAELQFTMTSADGGGQNYDVHVTYLDQDWT
jgi:hypothetical protein